MKTNYTVFKIVALALLFTCNSWGQNTVAQWNFNGANSASVPGGASSPLVATGAGTIGLIGVISTSSPDAFAAGVNGTGVGSSDPITTNPPNLAWATTNFPATGTANKTSGIQVNVSTVGYAGISFKFDQRLSNKAGNTYVVQYTLDRTVATPLWVDAQTFTFTPGTATPGPATGDIWYNSRTVDLSSIFGINENPNLSIRVVAAFDPVAGNYLASTSTSTYDGSGVVRWDMVTVSATTLAVSQFDAANNSFKVYPNPSNKEIVTLSQTQDIIVSDVTGKVVLATKNASTIDTRSFKTGVYFIKTASGATTKLLVN